MNINIGDILKTNPIHEVTCINIPTKINSQRTTKLFLLDPTFRQFCLTEENLKTHLDTFALYVTQKEAYTNKNSLGKISHTTTTAKEYWQQILKVANKNEIILGNQLLNLDTPKEIVAKKNRSFKNRIKNFFQKQELEDMFEIPEKNNNANQTKKIPK